MKCSVQGCPGNYARQFIIHTVKKSSNGDLLVFDNVPAEVCDVCSDTVFTPDTVRHLEGLIHQKNKPNRLAPVYEYA